MKQYGPKTFLLASSQYHHFMSVSGGRARVSGDDSFSVVTFLRKNPQHKEDNSLEKITRKKKRVMVVARRKPVYVSNMRAQTVRLCDHCRSQIL